MFDITPITNVLQYVDEHPQFALRIDRMKYSSGVMTLFVIDGKYQIRWDRVATSTFMKRWNNDSDEKFLPWAKQHLLKYLKLHSAELCDWDVRQIA